VADDLDFSGHAMVALYPPPGVADQLAPLGDLESDDLHCTVAYLGLAEDVDLDVLLAAVTPLALRDPIDTQVAGHGRFTGEEKDVLIALVDSPALERLRRDVVDALTAVGIGLPSEHGYTAHITLSYLDPATPVGISRLPARGVRFGSLTVEHGTRRIDIAFQPPAEDPAGEAIVPYARTAYAQGWAASGGPMTDTVRAGCVAAIEHAVRHAHDPHVLEATLRLGHLEGTWAAVYDRRDRLYAQHVDDVAAAWRRAARRVDLAQAIRNYQSSLGLTETASEALSDEEKRDKEHLRLIAQTVAAAIVHAILSPDSATPSAREAFVRAIAEALKAADAEGFAAAVAISADQAGLIGVDFDLAFTDAWKALGDLGTYWGHASGWVDQITKGVAKDLGAALAGLGRDASYQDMLDEAENVLTGVDLKTVSTLTDMAMSQSFSRGALRLYRREGVQTVDYITAGGARVCKVCEDHESKNPWPISDVPTPAVHPHCRCVLAASNPLEALDFLASYATGGGES